MNLLFMTYILKDWIRTNKVLGKLKEIVENEKSFDSPSTVSASYPVTSRSHYRMITYSINDLIDFVNLCVKKNYG